MYRDKDGNIILGDPPLELPPDIDDEGPDPGINNPIWDIREGNLYWSDGDKKE